MASKLTLDQYYLFNKKDRSKKGVILDRRRLKTQMTVYEKATSDLAEAFERIGVLNSQLIVKDLVKLEKISQLNKLLLAIVYRYYQSKNNSLKEVLLDFDNDFQNEVDYIMRNNIFKNLDNKSILFNFRQDFVIYLFLIVDLEDSLVIDSVTESEDYDEKQIDSESYQEDSYVDYDNYEGEKED